MIYFYAISGLISGFIATAFGFFTFSKNPKSAVNRTYGLLSLGIAVWGYAYFFWPLSQENRSHFLLSFQMLHLGAILIAPSFLAFILAFLGLHKQKKNLIRLAFLVAAIFAYLDFTPLFIQKLIVPRYFFKLWARPGIAYHLYLVFWSLCVVYPWLLLLKELGTKGLTTFRQNQLKHVLIAAVIGFVGGSSNYLLWYGIPVPPVGTILVAIHALILAYAIVRYRLMDIRVALTRTTIFVAVYALVLGLPFLLSTSGKGLLIKSLGAQWWLGPLILMASLGTIGPFVFIYLKNRTEAILLREQRKYQAVLRNAAVDLTRIRSLQKLLDFIAHTIFDSVRISHAAVYFFVSKDMGFVLQAQVNTPD
ncbi:MAG: histidine kinase N-terminal 7TM domain-containing protein, partial [Candidatus Omnitrophica bacterium]|nr:histidine kinase N-terminal 7TM domain-containing protein [Candidatus Omnitrophota bacterium]